MTTEQITLECTCGACPEQYDAYVGEEKVAYLRMRHGNFYVQVPDSGGTTVYTASPKGDGLFEYEEREFYLKKAREAIATFYNEKEQNDRIGAFYADLTRNETL